MKKRAKFDRAEKLQPDLDSTVKLRIYTGRAHRNDFAKCNLRFHPGSCLEVKAV